VAKFITQLSTENMEYVRSLLQQKQPAFSAAVELALVLAELELWPPRMRPDTGAGSAVHVTFPGDQASCG
jgi:hypothetical protein